MRQILTNQIDSQQTEMEPQSPYSPIKANGYWRNNQNPQNKNKNESEIPMPALYGIKYFGQDQFDYQQDRPCLQIIRLIDQERNEKAHRYFQGSARVQQILRYVYPYAMAFELAKVEKRQLYQVKKKINTLCGLLLQISALNRPTVLPQQRKLHETKLTIKNFDQIKKQFRTILNELYEHFMREAIRKYNIKNEHIQMNQKKKLKQEGLEYYRLCLKLLQVSVLNRKNGHNLDLQRIETSQRKQIAEDIDQLLKEYFPNKMI